MSKAVTSNRSAQIRLRTLTALVVLTAGWMTFDGAYALFTGDFVTPGSGEYAGQLGPWAAIPRSLGIDPRSVGIKALFVVFGLTYLGALWAFRRAGFRPALVACAGLALLYLPVGTLASVIVLGLLATLRSPCATVAAT
jgi:hypothetical protein